MVIRGIELKPGISLTDLQKARDKYKEKEEDLELAEIIQALLVTKDGKEQIGEADLNKDGKLDTFELATVDFLDGIEGCVSKNDVKKFNEIDPKILSLIKDLGYGDPSARTNALAALKEIESDVRVVVPALIKVLRDKHETLNNRIMAASALKKIGPSARAAILPLLDILKGDDDSKIRKEVAGALGEIGSATDQHIIDALDQAIARALGGKDNELLKAALEAYNKVIKK